MDFFLHSSTARYAQKLLDIEKEYGLAGLGFYWKAIELLMQSNSKVPLGDFQSLRYKQIGYRDCINIISNSGLFHIDENKFVTLANNVRYGIDRKSLDSYFEKMEKFYGLKPDQLTASPACTHEDTDTIATDVGTPESEHVGVCACSLDSNKDKTDIRAAKLLKKYMDENFPHLQQMIQPLTNKQFDDLRSRYSKDEIEDVFSQMENKLNLVNNNRSCYLTARSWLRHNYGKRNKNK